MYLSKTLIKTHKHTRHRALWHCRKVCSINIQESHAIHKEHRAMLRLTALHPKLLMASCDGRKLPEPWYLAAGTMIQGLVH